MCVAFTMEGNLLNEWYCHWYLLFVYKNLKMADWKINMAMHGHSSRNFNGWITLIFYPLPDNWQSNYLCYFNVDIFVNTYHFVSIPLLLLDSSKCLWCFPIWTLSYARTTLLFPSTSPWRSRYFRCWAPSVVYDVERAQ